MRHSRTAISTGQRRLHNGGGGGGGNLTYAMIRIHFFSSDAISATSPGPVRPSVINFRSSVGGANLGVTTWGGGNLSSAGPLSKVGDDDVTTDILMGSGLTFDGRVQGAYMTAILDTPSWVEEVEMAFGVASNAPTAFMLHGSNDGGTTWTLMWGETAVPAWTLDTKRAHAYAAGKEVCNIVEIDVSTTTSGAFGMARFEPRLTVSGAAMLGNAMAIKGAGSAYLPSKSQNGSGATFWTNGGAGASKVFRWMTQETGTPVELLIQVRPDGFREDPLNFDINYSTDGGLTYSLLASFTESAWTAGEIRVLTL